MKPRAPSSSPIRRRSTRIWRRRRITHEACSERRRSRHLPTPSTERTPNSSKPDQIQTKPNQENGGLRITGGSGHVISVYNLFNQYNPLSTEQHILITIVQTPLSYNNAPSNTPPQHCILCIPPPYSGVPLRHAVLRAHVLGGGCRE